MTRARSLQTTNILAWLTPVAVILVMVTRRHGQGESHALVSIEPTGSGNEAAGIISDVESAFGWVTESRHDSSILQLCRLPRDSF
jgi:hypothetical protein